MKDAQTGGVDYLMVGTEETMQLIIYRELTKEQIETKKKNPNPPNPPTYVLPVLCLSLL